MYLQNPFGFVCDKTKGIFCGGAALGFCPTIQQNKTP